MRRILMCMGIGLMIAGAAFWYGRDVGSDRAVKQRITRDMMQHHQLLELDRTFLARMGVQPNALVSGRYLFAKTLAGETTSVTPVEITVTEGQLRIVSGITAGNFNQTGNVVTWQYVGNEMPVAQYIGVIDGAELWGRIYVEPGQGWHEGVPPNYGVWQLHRCFDTGVDLPDAAVR